MERKLFFGLLIFILALFLQGCGDSALAGQAVTGSGDVCTLGEVGYTRLASICTSETELEVHRCVGGVGTPITTADCAVNDKVCENGKCVEARCTDTDGGVDPYTAGTINSVEGEYSDFCRDHDASFVNEYSCQSNGSLVFDQIDCGLGEICMDGACVDLPENETGLNDSQGGEMGLCGCSTPSHVNVVCENDDWVAGLDFDYFDTLGGGLRSSENADGAYCSYSNDLISEQLTMDCSGSDCDDFCSSHLSADLVMEIEENLNSCVDYFTGQCNGQVTIEGSYGEGGPSIEDWWTSYGFCS